MKSIIIMTISFVMTLVAYENSFAQTTRFDLPLNLSVKEYFDLLFSEQFDQAENHGHIPISIYSSFCISDELDDAILFLTITWNVPSLIDNKLSMDIQNLSNVLYEKFALLTLNPTIRKRWPIDDSKKKFIIRHVSDATDKNNCYN